MTITFEEFKNDCAARALRAPSCKSWALYFSETTEDGQKAWYVTARVTFMRETMPVHFGAGIRVSSVDASFAKIPSLIAQLGRIIEDERAGPDAASKMYERVLAELRQPSSV